MRTESKQHKIRIIKNREPIVFGVTIPQSFAHWLNILVQIRESGNCLILESGCRPEAFTMASVKQHIHVMERVKI